MSNKVVWKGGAVPASPSLEAVHSFSVPAEVVVLIIIMAEALEGAMTAVVEGATEVVELADQAQDALLIKSLSLDVAGDIKQLLGIHSS